MKQNFKSALLTTTLALTASLLSTPSSAEQVRASIEDRYTNVVENVPYTEQDCVMVNVPVYGTVQRQGDAAGSALLGMIIGGAMGKGLSGNNDGAAAGAVIGGLIGADKGSRPRNEQVVTGYRQERQCTEVTRYRQQTRTVYDYSIISFTLNGENYQFTFNK